MKKIISVLALAVALAVAAAPFSLTAFAEEYCACLYDFADVFTSEEELLLLDMLQSTADAADCDVGVVVSGELNGVPTSVYGEMALEYAFGSNGDSIMYLINVDYDSEGYYDWIALTGAADDRYYNHLDAIFESIYNLSDTNGFIGSVVAYCNYIGGNKGDMPLPEQSEADNGHRAVLSDLQDVLTDEEESNLLEYMDFVADEIDCHIGVVITDDLDGRDDIDYTESFMDENFPYGSDAVALLINNDYSKSSYEDVITTHGLADKLFASEHDYLFDSFNFGMNHDHEDDYHDGIEYFCSALYEINSDSKTDYDDNYFEQVEVAAGWFVRLFIPSGFAAIITAFIVNSFVKGYSKKKPVSARYYMDSKHIRFISRQDVFLHENTTSVRISSSSGGSRGGGGRSRGGRSSSRGSRGRR